MKKPSKLWRIAGLVFAVINVAGGAYAAALGEWMHAVVHVGLLSVGFLAWEIFSERGKSNPILFQSTKADWIPFRNRLTQ